ncbi:hypothetical protein PSTT_13624 [Puccinia striiformis]|uniref:Aminoacyl-transfer RNA synthetases class-II family profile domain-containing protein n=1 Tax=Puccinia striiformis TaxID=27350 RepID=A0A2S4UQZ2_9BASI|nr:hypothetical protein PSTT_13624 [Puccinia striiformis]
MFIIISVNSDWLVVLYIRIKKDWISTLRGIPITRQNDSPSSSPIIVAHDQSIQHYQPLEVQLGGLEAQFPRSETWTAGLFYGKNEPTSTDLEKLSELFKLPAQSIRVLHYLSDRGNLRLPTSEDQIVSAYGWIKTIRKQKNVSFVELIDGSTPQHLQVVIGPKDSEELETGCAIRVTGKLVSSRGDRQAKELKASSVSLIGACSALEYPLQKKTHSPAFLRKIPHLRRPHANTVDHVPRSIFILQAHHFFRSETPIITFNDCEGAGEVFSVKPDSQSDRSPALLLDPTSKSDHSHDQHFFGREAFLTVSAQLHLEALSASLGEYTHSDPLSVLRNLRQIVTWPNFGCWRLKSQTLMNVLESLLKSIIRNLHQSNNLSSQDLDSLGAPQQPYDSTATSWPRITYTKVVDLIQSHHKEHLSGKPCCRPLSGVNRWHLSMRSGLRGRLFSQGPTAACFDLLVPGVGELVGGSLRESNLNKLHENIIQKGMMSDGLALNGEDHKFQWYLELRKYGNPATGGFGIGWERLLSWITGVENVRECIAFPRVTGSGHC